MCGAAWVLHGKGAIMATLKPKRLTKTYVDSLKIPAKGFDVAPDDLIPGFHVRVYAATRKHPRGRKVYYIGYRPPGLGRAANWRNDPLGAHGGDTTAEKARKRAEAVRGDIAYGTDPKAELRERKREAEAERIAPTLEVAARDYIEGVAKKEKGNRAWKEQLRTFEHDVFPVLGKRLIHEIERSEISRLLKSIVDRGSSGQANEVYKQLRAFFEWYAERPESDGKFANPITKKMRPRKTLKRDRVLSDAELRAMWAALDVCPKQFRLLARFLLLTALRKGEAANARWGQVHARWEDDEGKVWRDVLVIPPEMYKTKKRHVLPLTAFAREQLEELGPPDPPKPMRYIFTTNGHDAPQGFGKWKAALDAEMLRIMRETDPEADLKGWRLHDLRRTARTLMSRAGVQPDHAERVLGHAIAGIRSNYDLFPYRHEMRDALEAVARAIEGILHVEIFAGIDALVQRIAPSTNVIRLRGRAVSPVENQRHAPGARSI
jgi:integrase